MRPIRIHSKHKRLKHAAVPYDAAKAHQYYIDNRELKGRAPAAAAPPKAAVAAKPAVVSPAMKAQLAKVAADKQKAQKAAAAKLVKQIAVTKKPVKLSKAMTAEVKKQAILANVKLLQAKFDALQAALAELVKAAKARSGVVTPTVADIKKEAEANALKAATPVKPLTAAEKDAKAKVAAKKYAEDHKTQTPDQQVAALNAKIADVRLKIAKFKAKQAAESALAAKKKKAAAANKTPAKSPTKKPTPVPVGAGTNKK